MANYEMTRERQIMICNLEKPHGRCRYERIKRFMPSLSQSLPFDAGHQRIVRFADRLCSSLYVRLA